MRPRVKICGVTRREDVELAVSLGADFVGLNFWPGSPRCLSPEQAVALRRAVGERARVVGVFVDAGRETMARVDARVGLDLLQLHGEEGPAEVEAFAGRAIKVFRVADHFDPDRLLAFEAAWGFLFDSGGAPAYGGSGRTWAWEAVAGLPTDKPFLVAGGIRPDNVVEVCERCRPWGVDVCSGVESAPGRKDPVLLQRLFEEITHVEVASRS